jgi:hypothetical protein
LSAAKVERNICTIVQNGEPRAGIQPQFVTLANGTDPISFIWSENIKRRHLTKGQRAIIAAKVRSFNEQSAMSQSAKQADADKASEILHKALIEIFLKILKIKKTFPPWEKLGNASFGH